MSDNYKGYPTFNDTKNTNLRAWNRFSVYLNIIQDLSTAHAKKYLEQFHEIDQAQIKKLVHEIREKGYSTVRSRIQAEVSATVH